MTEKKSVENQMTIASGILVLSVLVILDITSEITIQNLLKHWFPIAIFVTSFIIDIITYYKYNENKNKIKNFINCNTNIINLILVLAIIYSLIVNNHKAFKLICITIYSIMMHISFYLKQSTCAEYN